MRYLVKFNYEDLPVQPLLVSERSVNMV